MVGYEDKKKFVKPIMPTMTGPKWPGHCWLSIQNFIFPQRKIFLVLGGWVVGSLGGGVRQTPSPPVDKHFPGLAPG